MRPRARLTFASVVTAASLALGVSALMMACGKQGEAEHCSSANGNDDCESGMTCYEPPGLNAQICCPPKEQASTPECRGELAPLPTDAATDIVVDTPKPIAGDLGSACIYESQCLSAYRCRGGKCSYECVGDRDCQLTLPVGLLFCDVCGDHQCHATDAPAFHPDDAGVCHADAGADASDDTSTTEDTDVDTGADSGTDTSSVDSTVVDATDAD